MRTKIYCIILAGSLLFFDVFAQSHQKKIVLPQMLDYLTEKDKSREAVFKYDKNRDANYGFDKNARPTNLSNAERSKIRELINIRFAAYNKNHSDQYEYIKEPSKYFKQIIAVINSKGEKEVWIGCYCEVFKDQWRKHIMLVNDGGRCNLGFKINLTKAIVVSFHTGGLG